MMNTQAQTSKVEIRLCLGSSCFSRGKQNALTYLRDYVKTNGLEHRVSFKGSLCEELCKDGPHLFLDDTHYDHVDPSTVIDLLTLHLEQKQNIDKG